MTQEEKAKAYDKSLEKAKEMMGNTCSSEQTKCICQELFPEIAESEDEKIRKEIRDYFAVMISGASQTLSDKYSRWISYLEKQKEQKGVILEEIEDPCVRKYMELDKFALANMLAERDKTNKEIISAFDNLEKQKEQMPTNEEMLRTLRCEYEKGRADAIAEQEVKSAEWSEEDEEMIQDIIDLIDPQLAACDFHEIENWLKSLHNRIAPSNWKPTEEQMKKLRTAINLYDGDFGGAAVKPLMDLYEELKKL